MRLLRVLVFLPLWLLLTAEASPSPSPTDTATTPSPSPSPSPSPLPTPVNAFLSLDVTAGPPNTVINVSGGQFLPNQQMNLYWDQAGHLAGAATADANGSFNTRVKPFPDDKPGVHKLCASVQPNPCANFALQSATPTPSPTPEESPSPLPSPSPTSNATLVATPARTSNNIGGFDVISRPPFVFLPIFGVGALLLALAYWALSVIRRPRHLVPMPTAAVVHRATRPDYSAAFGTPPARSADTSPQSAWNEPLRGGGIRPPGGPAVSTTPTTPAPAPMPAPPAGPQPPAAPAGLQTDESAQHHAAWGLGVPDTGYPNLSTPESQNREALPEPPQPGD